MSEERLKLNEDLIREIETDVRLKLTVPAELQFPEQLVKSMQKGYAKSMKERPWNNEGQISSGSESSFACNVYKGSIDRILRFLDTFIKASKARGHEIQTEGYGWTKVIIKGEVVEVSILEKSTKHMIQDGKCPRQELRPTGKLIFRVRRFYDNIEFADGKAIIEEQLSRILAELELRAEDLKRERVEREKSLALEAEERRIRQDLEARQTEERRKFHQLMKLTIRYRNAKDLRLFVNQLEAKEAINGNKEPEFHSYLAWARSKADWMDPLINGNDALLDDEDKDVLQEVRQEEATVPELMLGRDKSSFWTSRYWNRNP